jgi:hypothetical protein
MRPELPGSDTKRKGDSGGGKPTTGGSYKLTVRSAADFWAASVRIFEFGSSVDFQFRIWEFGFKISSASLGPGSWLNLDMLKL